MSSNTDYDYNVLICSNGYQSSSGGPYLSFEGWLLKNLRNSNPTTL